MKEQKLIIEKLNLTPHPEGGYFREIYRSSESICNENLPSRYDSKRSFSTSIYYLLAGEQVSRFHRLKSDEIWHFYKGATLVIHCLNEKTGYRQLKIGLDFQNNTFPQYVIKKGTWFAAEVEDKNSYSLIGCTVAPGFEYEDFELASRSQLIEIFPQSEELIIRFTKAVN